MTVLNVLIYPEEHLKVVCDPVLEVNDETRKIIDDMFDTMYQEEGIGLAAPQVDILQRIITIDIEGDKQNQLVLINPEILEKDGEQDSAEGCLSVPGYIGMLKRPERVKLRAMNLDGATNEYEFSGFAATCIMHENDHLNGVVYPDIAEEVYTTEQYNEMMAEIAEESENKNKEKEDK